MSFNDVSNTELFRQFVEQGSQEAISRFFQNQSDLFYRVALKYTRNTADAEDVIQSAFITIIDKASQYNGIKTDEEKLLRSWCLSIVVQCALMKIRSESSRRNREYKYSNANLKTFDEEKNMENQLENQAVHQKVQNAIVQLPEKYRIPIHLKYIEGLEFDDIAGILKLNANTLRSLIKRGLEKLSLQLKDEKVTLSSAGLIGLIQGLPMEEAPTSVKTIASKIFEVPHSSKLLITNSGSKISAFYAKAIFSLVAISLTIVLGIYGFNLFKIKDSISPKINNQISENFTNQKWEFIYEKDRNIPLMIGEWKWNDEHQSMVTRINSFIFLSLPIKPQTKPFVIEYVLAPYVDQESLSPQLFFNNGWVKDNQFLGNEFIKTHNSLATKHLKFDTIKTYYYNNDSYLFNGDICVAINRYSLDLNGANVALLTRNYIFQKITSYTLEKPPAELLNAIEANKLKKGEYRNTVNIDKNDFGENLPAKQ